MARVVFPAVVLSAALLAAGAVRASLYSPDDTRFAVPVAADGTPSPLPFDEFKRRLAVLANARNESVDSPDRRAFLGRIAEREKIRNPSPADAAALAVDLLRVGRPDKALNVLGPRTADRRPDYFVFATLGHVHAASGEQGWADALRYHQDGLIDAELPAEVKGLTKAQRDWWAKLDTTYVPHFYRVRRAEADARRGLSPSDRQEKDAAEDVLPLFPLRGRDAKADPVRFVNEHGEYEPGVLAAAERAKLPPDAVAVVQQLVFWVPSDARLYWLLGELYAADGDLESAQTVFNNCVEEHKFGNRKVLMAHRQAVRAAIDARPRPAPPAAPINMRTIAVYFAAVAVIAVLAFARTVFRRGRGDCGPVG